jgi:hypothetical protein
MSKNGNSESLFRAGSLKMTNRIRRQVKKKGGGRGGYHFSDPEKSLSGL